MFHLSKEDLWEGVDKVLTVGEFYNQAQEDGTQIIFI
jgi:peroxiredoxin family protein